MPRRRYQANKPPEPSPEELMHTAQVELLLRKEIRHSGSMPFWRFMEVALYEPGLGYYTAGKIRFGKKGDFITAPELGNLFARSVARATAEVLGTKGDKYFIEVGAGTGKFAAAALAEWEALGTLPRRYFILDRGIELRHYQYGTLLKRVPQHVDRVEWLDTPLTHKWRGVLFANEVVDALPVHRFVVRAGELYEIYVGINAADQLCLLEGEANPSLWQATWHVADELNMAFEDDYQSEILPGLSDWIEPMCSKIEAGVAVFIDYGYPRREYYLPERTSGTLSCHYRHYVHDNPLLWPGLQDITAWVDFTALAEAASRADLPVAGFNSQAQFLLAAGLLDVLELEQRHKDEKKRYALAQEAKRLTLPGEMGERFKVICFARGIDRIPVAFTTGSQLYQLVT